MAHELIMWAVAQMRIVDQSVWAARTLPAGGDREERECGHGIQRVPEDDDWPAGQGAAERRGNGGRGHGGGHQHGERDDSRAGDHRVTAV